MYRNQTLIMLSQYHFHTVVVIRLIHVVKFMVYSERDTQKYHSIHNGFIISLVNILFLYVLNKIIYIIYYTYYILYWRIYYDGNPKYFIFVQQNHFHVKHITKPKFLLIYKLIKECMSIIKQKLQIYMHNCLRYMYITIQENMIGLGWVQWKSNIYDWEIIHKYSLGYGMGFQCSVKKKLLAQRKFSF